ncbi:MAG: hypothetical protein A3A33_01235 [Candidatus Yanofskybacteria bacterium RIFCSPLOWO2_01_FULL_49_25]|uniref:Uncharacterized protein n=1 Tax=Candidatus Yanofskybacteria bacterium RIFCSPLOWO2_01_FULL_49_25 TaxID=1802701 RepID=A0A1F8GZM9_9BACT|nr:MAG: hypothetical protein A3A33_01235 [Candidatus Yanofskybacteria bacterium RIFCSPLOWO2_01_FULL_49_25]
MPDNLVATSTDRKNQLYIVLLALVPPVLLGISEFSDADSSVMISGRIGVILGKALIPMLIGLITYGLSKKKLLDPNDTKGLKRSRNIGLIAVVISLLLFSLS